MLTQEQVLTAVRGGRESTSFDGRDYLRLCEFFAHEHLEAFGFNAIEIANWQPKPWTEEAVREQIARDVAFGFEKAINKRGISSSCMFEVVKMWGWVMENERIANWPEEQYAQYGLPLFKAAAAEFGLPDPIAEYAGDEFMFSSEADE